MTKHIITVKRFRNLQNVCTRLSVDLRIVEKRFDEKRSDFPVYFVISAPNPEWKSLQVQKSDEQFEPFGWKSVI
jgi:hypothetical protein